LAKGTCKKNIFTKRYISIATAKNILSTATMPDSADDLATEIVDYVFSSQSWERPVIAAMIRERLADTARLDWVLDHCEVSNPHNSSDSYDTRETIDRARAKTP
jgi:hypothetical protein